ncbi:Exportin-7 [Auxenochlorella protothecoides]|uniref:Exportin-7 n=1 Tax=Auxenochlorella protothecoides TaxID=3075 RepID=A0A087SAK0_AUXPR|nr:Exportin-7 [Auxenochlorella protothecoides]KFM22754.1 Exportin-7 [Auxenochlorella protothecoides]
MDIVQQLPQLEALCLQLYTAQTILDVSSSPYAQLLAASSLLKVVTEFTLSNQVKLDMRTYFLQYLNGRGPTLEPYVVAVLVQLICRMTKLGWFEDSAYRSIVEDAGAFLEPRSNDGSLAHYMLGLRLLNAMVLEANSPTPHRTLTQHRKVAVGFRDAALYKILQLALGALQRLPGMRADNALLEQALRLLVATLSFDFVGTCLDESAEDLGTIQIPTAWRPAVEDAGTLQLLWGYYAGNEPPLSSLALESLVRLASVRRSLFSSDAVRSAFLARLVEGSRDVLRDRRGLHHHANYHEFCRLLGRLKTNYQLGELVALAPYPEWIGLVADFTINSLTSWQWASGSVFYLLGLWSRLVSSMPYLKGEAPSLLDLYVPKISRAFLTSRLESVRTVVQDGLTDDPLDSEEQLQDQLDSLPYLFRFQYEKMAEALTCAADPLIAAYASRGAGGAVAGGAASSSSPPRDAAVLEGQLTWIVYMVGAVVRGRASASGADAQEAVDGDLAARVFGSFRKVYIGEAVMHSSKVYVRLGESVGLADHAAVMNVILAKMASNLKVYCGAEEVISATLELFKDLASGYMSGKLLIKLEAISYLLTHHTAEYFPFLAGQANLRARTTFYSTLARLLFMDDTPDRFKAFVAPMQQVFDSLATASRSAGSPAALRASVSNETVAGLFRDLRGVAAATSTRRTYGMLFDWLYPANFPVILACLEAWSGDPVVTTPLLKFVNEFVLNKSQRLIFDSSSPNGILLFREVSKVLVTYGNQVLSAPRPADVYGGLYKGSWICLSILSRALGGSYVNFGVFELYGDPALNDALDMAVRLALNIPLADILAYRKVCKAYFALVDMLCASHVPLLAARDTPTFVFLLSSLDAGLKSLDVAVSSQCAAAIDNLAGYYFLHMPGGHSPNAAARAISEHVRQRPDLFPQLLTTLFEIVMFEDCSNMWSLSRPMLSLILVSEQVYEHVTKRVAASQPPERQSHLAACLERVMAGVTRSLEPKNRDKFTQNFTIARHDYRART